MSKAPRSSKPEQNAAIARAIECCGSQGALAERANLSQQYISKLLANGCVPKLEAAIAISRATGGKVRIRELVPGAIEAVEEIEREIAANAAPEPCL